MDARLPPDIRELLDQLEAAEREARALVAGLSERQGAWRLEPGSWSISECFDHLAAANRVYLSAMQEPAERARLDGRPRRGPATAGWLVGLFVRSLEPPPGWWSRRRAPRKIRPRPAPTLAATPDEAARRPLPQAIGHRTAEAYGPSSAGRPIPELYPGFYQALHLATHLGQSRTLRNLYRTTRGEPPRFHPQNPSYPSSSPGADLEEDDTP